MKSLFMVFILFLHSNGKLEVVQTVDKCNSWSAHSAVDWLSNPKHWTILTPIEGFVVERRVTEKEWEENCYNPKWRSHYDWLWYGKDGDREKLLKLPIPQSP